MASSPDSDDVLRAWIRDHRVSFELAPRIELRGDRHIQVGYDLTLYAQYPTAFAETADSGEHLQHYARLKALALFALPAGIEPSLCSFSPPDASYHLRVESNWIPEIELTCQIVHADSTFGEIDAEEKSCAQAIETTLTTLGVHARAWTK